MKSAIAHFKEWCKTGKFPNSKERTNHSKLNAYIRSGRGDPEEKNIAILVKKIQGGLSLNFKEKKFVERRVERYNERVDEQYRVKINFTPSHPSRTFDQLKNYKEQLAFLENANYAGILMPSNLSKIIDGHANAIQQNVTGALKITPKTLYRWYAENKNIRDEYGELLSTEQFKKIDCAFKMIRTVYERDIKPNREKVNQIAHLFKERESNESFEKSLNSKNGPIDLPEAFTFKTRTTVDKGMGFLNLKEVDSDRVTKKTAQALFDMIGIEIPEKMISRDVRTEIYAALEEGSEPDAPFADKLYSIAFNDPTLKQYVAEKLDGLENELSTLNNNVKQTDHRVYPVNQTDENTETVTNLFTGNTTRITGGTHNTAAKQPSNPIYEAINAQRQFAEDILKTLQEIQIIDNDTAMRYGRLESLQDYIMANDKHYKQTDDPETDIRHYAKQVIENSNTLIQSLDNRPTVITYPPTLAEDDVKSVEKNRNVTQPLKKTIFDELEKRQENLEISGKIIGLVNKAKQLYDFSYLKKAEEMMAAFNYDSPLSGDVNVLTMDERAQHIEDQIKENMVRVEDILNDYKVRVPTSPDDNVVYEKLDNLKQAVEDLILEDDIQILPDIETPGGESEEAVLNSHSALFSSNKSVSSDSDHQQEKQVLSGKQRAEAIRTFYEKYNKDNNTVSAEEMLKDFEETILDQKIDVSKEPAFKQRIIEALDDPKNNADIFLDDIRDYIIGNHTDFGIKDQKGATDFISDELGSDDLFYN